MSSDFTIYEDGTSLDWDGDTRVCIFNLANKTIVLCWVPSHIGIRGNKKRQTLLPSPLWVYLVPRLAYPILILNNIIFFPCGKMNGMVRSRTSFILASRSEEIGSSPTGSAGRIMLCPHR